VWFVGLIVGGMIGAVTGSSSTAFWFAVLGAILGHWIGRMNARAKELVQAEQAIPRHSPSESQIKTMEARFQQIELRLLTLEKQPAYAEQVLANEAEFTAGDLGEMPVSGQVADSVTINTKAASPPFEAPVPATDPVVAGKSMGAFAAATPAAENIAADAWWNKLIGGNLVAKMGVIILFVGVGFLLKYAYDNAFLPVPLRLAGVAIAGLAMLIVGARLLKKRRLYGLILQGGGIGLMYLDVFFALKIYGMIAPQLGFALFMVLGVAATLLAVRQDAAILAILGLSGAFMAPVLAGSQSSNHVLLFSYYTLLNIFIIAVSWFKSWRALNLVGFGFTFVIGLFWGWNNYRPSMFDTVEPFVVGYFLMYLAIPILFAQRQPPQLRGVVDGTLVFGMPITVAAMQAGLVKNIPYGLAWSAGCTAVIYALLAAVLWRRENMRVLAEAHAALALVLGSLAVAFAFDAYPTFAFWTLEGAALVWIGLRQGRLAMRLFGLALQAAGTALFLIHYGEYDLVNPWFNDFIVGCALVAFSALLSSGLMNRYREILIRGGEATANMLLGWGVLWWFIGGLHMVHDGLPSAAIVTAGLMFTIGSIFIAELVGARLRWVGLRRTQPLLLAAMLFAALRQFIERDHPLADYGWLAWPLALMLLYFSLARQERDNIAILSAKQHVAGLWFATLLLAWELAWQFDHHGFAPSWSMSMWGLIPALVLGGTSYSGFDRAWPFVAHAKVYRDTGSGLLVGWCVVWSFFALTDAARVSPLPYFPLLNILDFAHIGALLATGLWVNVRAQAEKAQSEWLQGVLSLLAFLVFNAIILRAVHHWTGVCYSLEAMVRSVLAQAVLALIWTATALVLMVYANRSGKRNLWIGGAALLAAVVGKLFLLDLANSGTIERIVTFIGVGVGLLAVGYFAPVPPGVKENVS